MRYIIEMEKKKVAEMSKFREKEIKILKTLNLNGTLISVESEKDKDAVKKATGAKEVYVDEKVKWIPDEDEETEVKLIDTYKEINADKIHEEGITGENVIVGILDTGVDIDHNCFEKAYHWWSFNDNFDNLHSHGTHVAGIVASNDYNYKGIAPNCTIYDFRVLDSEGYGYNSDIINAMWKAVEANCDVINMSLGSDYPNDGKDILCKQVNEVVNWGVVVVVAAGNSGGSGGSCGAPASAEKAITVGATMKGFDAVAYFSSYGGNYDYQKPEVCAPGTNVWSAVPNSRWAMYSGTSMAAPHITGAIALIMELLWYIDEGYNTERIKDIIESCCDYMVEELPEKQGYGKINCEQFLEYIEIPEEPGPPEEPPEKQEQQLLLQDGGRMSKVCMAKI